MSAIVAFARTPKGQLLGIFTVLLAIAAPSAGGFGLTGAREENADAHPSAYPA